MHTFTKDNSKKGNYVVGHYVVNEHGQKFVPQFRGLSFGTALTVVSSLNGAGHIGAEMLRVLEQCQS